MKVLSVQTVIVILGSPNGPEGELSEMAQERLQTGLVLFRENPGSRILLTGGWGPHFNRSTEPHALHAQKYLEKKGVDPEVFLPYALSRNTIEDAQMSEPILQEASPATVLIVTSDFHLERARAIFERFLETFDLSFHGARHRANEAELNRLREHERRALRRFRQSAR